MAVLVQRLVSGFNRVVWVNFFLKKSKRCYFSFKKKQKSTDCNLVFDRVLLGQPGHTGFFLPLFFIQPDLITDLDLGSNWILKL